MPGTLRASLPLSLLHAPLTWLRLSPNTKPFKGDVYSTDICTRHREEIPQNSPHALNLPSPPLSLSAFLPNAFLGRSLSHIQLLPTEAPKHLPAAPS